MRWRNFHIWRGRLPHWRADDVNYYVVFRHRRDLEDAERQIVLRALLLQHGRRLDVRIACVLPDRTELIFRAQLSPDGRPYELAEAVEAAKKRAARSIMKRSGERYPPFWEESFDRIIRDDAEFEERWLAILGGPVDAGLADEPEDDPGLWVAAP
ncbi:MAG: hypothetical protein SNJ61_10830 [Fimbriimonadaceae bacterium]